MGATLKEEDLLGPISSIEIIARGSGIRSLAELHRLFGHGNWRKLKGLARVRMDDGSTAPCEIHWYEAHGIGKFKMKVKRVLSP